MTDQQDPDEDTKKQRPRRWGWVVAGSLLNTAFTLCVLGGITAATLAVMHPESPLPPEWNPTAQFNVADPVSPLTSWKFRAALNDPAQCVATLQAATNADVRPSREDSEHCHIRNSVAVSQIGGTTDIGPPLSETACATALRLAMWERHGIQPAAMEHFGSEVSVIRQVGSYNCRPIRTTQGPSERWSTHSTADAIDISGFDLADGRRIRLVDDWQAGGPEAAFLRAVRDSACTWFATTLGPDYNSLHADHFHLQARGWGTCR